MYDLLSLNINSISHVRATYVTHQITSERVVEC